MDGRIRNNVRLGYPKKISRYLNGYKKDLKHHDHSIEAGIGIPALSVCFA